VLPLATSVDGRRFTFQASLHGLELQVGGYVLLEAGGVPRLGQVLGMGARELRTGDVDGDVWRRRRVGGCLGGPAFVALDPGCSVDT